MADDTTTTTGRWPQVSNKPSFPAIEEEVLARWRAEGVAELGMHHRDGGPTWTFYEGPPTANGLPGTHHVEARTFKDVFPRYRTMKGYDVLRKGGWDCHGLPVELEVEKELGLDSKADIEAYGIEEFNRRCRESVTRYVDAWEAMTERIGFWLDLDDAYLTMAPTYIDSLWWALRQLSERGLLFEDHRVAPYCGRCGTALSDAEVAQGYRTIEDPSVFVRFPVLDGPLAERGAALAVWTTTPWTLLSNTAVAVAPDVTYALVRDPAAEAGADLVVLASALVTDLVGEDAEVLEEMPGSALVGAHYRAPFTLVEVEDDYRYVVAGDFVSVDEGTGLVHMAPAFGAEDMEVGRREGLPVINPVDADARFTTGPWEGMFVKDADEGIMEAMREQGVLLAHRTYEHTYPFCWRCDRPLIYWAKPSWYIRTTARKQQLLEVNSGIGWHPEHIRDGRFGNWLENNVDWALSRDRYWGTPLPFWRCGDCGHVTVIGSRAELSEHAGRDLSDLDPHRPYVDEVVFPCPECAETARRVPDVADAWFDSGAMPFAQFGYPYRGEADFERRFPADFICEAIDQTRGWFYTLLAEATLLFDTTSYRTVLCLGHIVAEDGRKMSKSLGNVIDPWELIEAHGADPLRWLMLAEGNPWVNRRVGHHVAEDVVRRLMMTLWNTHYFFLTYAQLDDFRLSDDAPAASERPVMDRWVLAELAGVCDDVDAALDGYDVTNACRRLEGFVDDLSNWYVRRTRRRFWKAWDEDPRDKASAHHTLRTCLVTLAGLMAPFTPFIADRLWYDLERSQVTDAPVSVHLTDFPTAEGAWRDEALVTGMRTARHLVELGRQARNEAGVRVRQPLGRALVTVPAARRAGLAELLGEIADELNVKQVQIHDGTDELVDRSVQPDFSTLGPAFQRDAQRVGEHLRGLEGAAAESLLGALTDAGRTTITLGDDQFEITPDMVEIVETPRTGWELATDGPTSIALDLELDESLRVEGAARELARALNDQRKRLDLPLDRRVAISIDVDPADLGQRLQGAGWYAWIAREVLADDVRQGRADAAAEVDLEGLGRAWVAVHP